MLVGAMDLRYRLGLMCQAGDTLVSPGDQFVLKTILAAKSSISISSLTLEGGNIFESVHIFFMKQFSTTMQEWLNASVANLETLSLNFARFQTLQRLVLVKEYSNKRSYFLRLPLQLLVDLATSLFA